MPLLHLLSLPLRRRPLRPVRRSPTDNFTLNVEGRLPACWTASSTF